MIRDLRKTPQFLQQVHEARQKVPGLLEVIGGAEWVLVRQPELGMTDSRQRYRSWPVHPEEGVTFKILYTFDHREVVLHGLFTAVAPGKWR
jgi:hypothetical protein